MVTTAGAGYSACGPLAVTRWREDATRDHWGSFYYLRDVRSGAVWSAGFQPTAAQAGSYEVSFGFQVSDRFVSLAARLGSPLFIGGNANNFGADFSFNSQNNTTLRVDTFFSANPDNRENGAFMLIVY